MQVNVIGVDHCCAAAVREKAAFTESHMLDFSSIIMELGAAEAVILSTCNRSEVYYLLPEAAAAPAPALEAPEGDDGQGPGAEAPPLDPTGGQ